MIVLLSGFHSWSGYTLGFYPQFIALHPAQHTDRQCHWKVLLRSFHMNGHDYGNHPHSWFEMFRIPLFSIVTFLLKYYSVLEFAQLLFYLKQTPKRGAVFPSFSGEYIEEYEKKNSIHSMAKTLSPKKHKP